MSDPLTGGRLQSEITIRSSPSPPEVSPLQTRLVIHQTILGDTLTVGHHEVVPADGHINHGLPRDAAALIGDSQAGESVAVSRAWDLSRYESKN